MADWQATDVDAVTREVIYGGIRAAIQEMEVLIGRAAMSPVIRDKKDYFMGLYDADGRMIHALTSYSGPGIVTPVLQRYDAAGIAPGDIFFYNDPYSTNGAVQHQPDVVVLTPYHWPDGQLAGFAAAFGHFEDIGGLRYGSGAMDAKDIFNEGVAYPPMRVGRDFSVDPAFMSMLMRNSRRPDYVSGDWRALQAGCRLGVERMLSLIRRWGPSAVAGTMSWVIEQSAVRVRRVIAENIPDGEYYAQHYADGTIVGRPKIKISARLTKRGDDLVLDLSGSDEQVAAPLNYIASLPVMQLLMLMQLASLDQGLSANQGALTNLTELIVAPGTVVSPLFPAPLNARATPRSGVIACLTDLIAQANGGRITASSPTHVICGFRFENDDRAYSETLGVGQGARPFGDGPDVIYGAAQRNYPVESLEPALPLRIEEYSIRKDTGGPGRYRGGCGVLRAVRVLADGYISPRLGSTAMPVPGVAGGAPGGLGKVSILRANGREEQYPGIYNEIPFYRGDLVRLESAGGGGWGNPYSRPEQEVLGDVRELFVSEEQAAEAYGVYIRDGEIDRQATGAGPRGHA
jgi:N-methylhydantoinase B